MIHKMLEDADRNYERNRYYRERKKLKDRIRMYKYYPGFVAKLTSELEALERDWKALERDWKARRSKK